MLRLQWIIEWVLSSKFPKYGLSLAWLYLCPTMTMLPKPSSLIICIIKFIFKLIVSNIVFSIADKLFLVGFNHDSLVGYLYLQPLTLWTCFERNLSVIKNDASFGEQLGVLNWFRICRLLDSNLWIVVFNSFCFVSKLNDTQLPKSTLYHVLIW